MQFALITGGGALLWGAVTALFVKYYSSGLSWMQAFLISVTSLFLPSVLFVLYSVFAPILEQALRAQEGPQGPHLWGLYNLIIVSIIISLGGALITRVLARNYGIKKSGWLGVGGKAILSGLIPSLILLLLLLR